jgi:hypothetical protein
MDDADLLRNRATRLFALAERARQQGHPAMNGHAETNGYERRPVAPNNSPSDPIHLPYARSDHYLLGAPRLAAAAYAARTSSA